MRCFIADLRCKEVINICTGVRLGYVGDVELDTASGKIVALVVPGPCRFFGLFGREDDYVISWDKISRIGEDIILLEFDGEHKRARREKKKWL